MVSLSFEMSMSTLRSKASTPDITLIAALRLLEGKTDFVLLDSVLLVPSFGGWEVNRPCKNESLDRSSPVSLEVDSGIVTL